MKHLHQTYTIKAPIAEVWQAFVNPEIINQWSGGPAKMDAEDGTEFSLWGGDIFGKKTKVVENELLEQDWFGDKSWQEPSKLSFKFSEQDGSTVVELDQTNVPDAEAQDIDQGWKDYYLGAIKELLEQS